VAFFSSSQRFRPPIAEKAGGFEVLSDEKRNTLKAARLMARRGRSGLTALRSAAGEERTYAPLAESVDRSEA
jgi:hypothetical protein